MLLVSHDRALIDAVAERTLAIEDGTIRAYDGGWADLVRSRAERQEEAKEERPAKEPKARPPARAKPAPDPLAGIEREIEAKERRIGELEERLAADWSDVDTIAAHRRAREELQTLLARWETMLAEVAERST